MSTIQQAARNLRVLAIDVRPRRIGYVCLDGGHKLLAARAARFTSRGAARARFASIFDELRPAVLVLRRTRRRSWRDWPGTGVIQRLARAQARRRSIGTVFVSEDQLSRFYDAQSFRNKHGMAMFLISNFPELESYKVRPRKPWDPEHRFMLVFDAAALAIVYRASLGQ